MPECKSLPACLSKSVNKLATRTTLRSATSLLRVVPRSTLIPTQMNEHRMSVCLNSTARLLHSYEGDEEKGALTITQDRIV